MPLTTKPLFKRPEISEQFDPDRKIVLHCGDTSKFIETIPDKTIKLIITSPPYNLGKVYENKSGIDAYLECQKPAIEQMVRVLRDDGSICWQVGNFVENAEVFPLDILFYDIFKNHALKLRNRIIWRFNHGLHEASDFPGDMKLFFGLRNLIATPSILTRPSVPSKYPGKLHFKGPKRGLPSGNPLGKKPLRRLGIYRQGMG